MSIHEVIRQKLEQLRSKCRACRFFDKEKGICTTSNCEDKLSVQDVIILFAEISHEGEA